MKEMIEMKQNLYLKDVERLIQRRADKIEKKAINDAYVRHWSPIKTAKLINGGSDRVDRQNDFA